MAKRAPITISLTFSQMGYCDMFLEKINEFRKSRQFCDVTLILDGGRLECHKAILIMASEYFQAMFSCNMQESLTSQVNLPYITLDIMELILDFVYTGSLTISQTRHMTISQLVVTVQNLLQAADMFQLHVLTARCESYLTSKVTPHNCLQMYALSHLYNLDKLKDKSSDIRSEQFEAVSKSKEFLNLDSKSLIAYISDSDIEVANENVVFTAVTSWYGHDPTSRAGEMKEIFSHVRLPFCTLQFFNDCVQKYELLRTEEMKHYLQEFVDYHQLSITDYQPSSNADYKQSSKTDCKQSSKTDCKQSSKTDYKLSSKTDCKQSSKTDCKQSSNAYYQHLGSHCGGNIEAHKRLTSRFSYTHLALVVLGGRCGWNKANHMAWYLDEGTKHWRKLCDLPPVSCRYAVSTLGNHLYITGGRNDTGTLMDWVWKFNCSKKMWYQMTDMNERRERHGAAVCRGLLYVIGGCDRAVQPRGTIYVDDNARLRENPGHVFTDVEIYNPQRDSWTHTTPLLDGVFDAAVASTQRHIYVIGGMKLVKGCVDSCHYAAQRLDVATRQWSRLSDIFHTVDTRTTAVVGHNIYVHCSDAKLAVYNTVANMWTEQKCEKGSQLWGISITAKSDRILALGGDSNDRLGRYHNSDLSKRVYVFEPEKKKWKEASYTLPKRLAECGVTWLQLHNDCEKDSANESSENWRNENDGSESEVEDCVVENCGNESDDSAFEIHDGVIY